MTIHACFYFREKKKIAQKRETSTVTYAFYILIFFLHNCLQSNKLFVSVVTLCDIFILDLNNFLALMFFDKIRFSLKNKPHAYFFAVLFSYLLANRM